MSVDRDPKELIGKIDLFALWIANGQNYKLPITHAIEYEFIISKVPDAVICLEVGDINELSDIIPPHKERWNEAHKITHEGFLYIRVNDIWD